MNYKGLVNNYCTAQGLVLDYKGIACNSDSTLQWKSECEFEGTNFVSVNSYRSKKDADQEVAKAILDRINKKTKIALEEKPKAKVNKVDDEKIEFTLQKLRISAKYVALIDVENIKPKLDGLKLSSCDLYFPMSNFATVDEGYYNKFGKTVKINSSVSDAADHLMTFQAALLTFDTPKTVTFIIVSRDKAISNLKILLEDKGYTVLHFTNAKEFENMFR